MKDTEEKKKNSKSRPENQEVDRREFIEKSAKDIGACGFAIFDLARTIKREIMQEVVDNVVNSVKDVIRRP